MSLGRMENFSRVALKRFMKQAGMNSAKLAAYCGISKPVAARWVSGEHLPAVALVPKIANALGVTVMDLARKEDPNDVDLVDLRYIRGLSTVEVGKHTGLSPYKIALLEEAVSMPNISYLNTLADYYALAEDELLRAWVARRVNLYGVDSLEFLDEETSTALASWILFYQQRSASPDS